MKSGTERIGFLGGFTNGDVAQWLERLIAIQKVQGSNPCILTPPEILLELANQRVHGR